MLDDLPHPTTASADSSNGIFLLEVITTDKSEENHLSFTINTQN
jgi:hypothetical protein